MTFSQPFLDRNRLFSATRAHHGKKIYPAGELCVITCLDPRTDPAEFLQAELGEIAVIRNAGGRVTREVLNDLTLITFLAEKKLRPESEALFEVAIVHHNDCGTKALADEQFRHAFAEHTHLSEAALVAEAVVDPALTVATDVDLALHHNALSRKISVSGHVYDVETGLLTTVIPTSPMPAIAAPEMAPEEGAR
ncbi:carbonic anhydrase [Gryllotalpicola protaetiae]|uniref:carbonic anhydrase n=1 Tax=Gryllotalpicola protaetiae TaxID=2419771 RepID=A0A387BPR5_9MICO|nr:carbonic anhydrase [Gryllotalpicola protaetiae]AYG04044.1 carbonic anhydrase [Gryllotalpicola protaetiae]